MKDLDAIINKNFFLEIITVNINLRSVEKISSKIIDRFKTMFNLI
jgi:hypothetical protein